MPSASVTSWPYLVGTPVNSAVARITRDRPELSVHVLASDAIATADFDEMLVRVYADDGVVVRMPRVG